MTHVFWLQTAARSREKNTGSATPNFVSEHDIHSDPDSRKVRVAIPLPVIHDRQIWAAKDPLPLLINSKC